LIDIHFHCLPGIDDGPRDWQQAIALCRAAAEEGTDTIVATPHVLRDAWINDDAAIRDQLIFKLNAFLGGQPSVLAGCEYFFSADAVELVERGRWSPLTLLNRSRYLLLEFPPGELPVWTAAIFHELSILDVVPVIAHPERHRLFASRPQLLEELVGRGALVQLTAGSLLGDFGAGPLAACGEFFRRGLVHLVASDAHSVDLRPPRLAAAREYVLRQWGKEAEIGIFESNAEAILRSDAVVWTGAAHDARPTYG
jgi:protein-tyrosine phosphatase